uniref:Uncharacterized protein n=1 Tax=Timema bartmani TaxID=61472 RepID=A0A7R9I5Q3_9NEOP|nr:unnamed protein product [Timema bartmani]
MCCVQFPQRGCRGRVAQASTNLQSSTPSTTTFHDATAPPPESPVYPPPESPEYPPPESSVYLTSEYSQPESPACSPPTEKEGSYSKLSNLIRHKHQCHQTPPNPAHQDACWDEEVLCSALDQIEKEKYNRVKCLNELEKNKSYSAVLSEETSNEPNVIVLEDVGRDLTFLRVLEGTLALALRGLYVRDLDGESHAVRSHGDWRQLLP